MIFLCTLTLSVRTSQLSPMHSSSSRHRDGDTHAVESFTASDPMVPLRRSRMIASHLCRAKSQQQGMKADTTVAIAHNIPINMVIAAFVADIEELLGEKGGLVQRMMTTHMLETIQRPLEEAKRGQREGKLDVKTLLGRGIASWSVTERMVTVHILKRPLLLPQSQVKRMLTNRLARVLQLAKSQNQT